MTNTWSCIVALFFCGVSILVTVAFGWIWSRQILNIQQDIERLDECLSDHVRKIRHRNRPSRTQTCGSARPVRYSREELEAKEALDFPDQEGAKDG